MTKHQLELLTDVMMELHYQAGINNDDEMREVADALSAVLKHYKETERQDAASTDRAGNGAP